MTTCNNSGTCPASHHTDECTSATALICTNHYTCIALDHNPACPAKLDQLTGEFAQRLPEPGEV